MIQMLTNCSNGTAGRPATKANSGSASESSADSRAGKKEGAYASYWESDTVPGLATPSRGAQFHVRARGRHTTASAVRVVRHPSRWTPSPPWVVLSVATCRYELQRRRPTPFRSGASKGWARSPTPSSPHYRRTPCTPIIRRRVAESGASLQNSRAG